ncbi:hypothetical protein CANCADRAFT_2934 [Tortispora caseinolytica NRRL Y-17796]|uniref:Methyltransferase type 11 domain-containing protein n=1 Tax=Tortispora caseinolytica NRRL Y-17796 TaxID=767744 RepID=A0A1E4THK8_9ASCO|nr:hypothetical protein CANCADRAFT_2934 [Tortispora caseinolytica NRRL Y-17796]
MLLIQPDIAPKPILTLGFGDSETLNALDKDESSPYRLLEEREFGSNCTAADSTPVYDEGAASYDRNINREEYFMAMSFWRKWVANQVVTASVLGKQNISADGRRLPDVLEVSAGTGRNIPFLDVAKIGTITFTDASSAMLDICREKFQKRFPKYKYARFSTIPAEFVHTSEISPLKNKKYDVVYETFGLCSHADPIKALQEMLGALKPGGRVVLVEHGRSKYKWLNKILDNGAIIRARKWGCRWNLDIDEIVRQTGAEVLYHDRSHLGTTYSFVLKRPDDNIVDATEKKYRFF